MAEIETFAQRQIVVGVDGSEHSLEALRWAARIAPALDCEIEAVMAWFDPRESAWSSAWGYLTADLDPEGGAEKALESAVDEAFFLLATTPAADYDSQGPRSQDPD